MQRPLGSSSLPGMNQPTTITQAEDEIRTVLESASQPLTTDELSTRLESRRPATIPRSVLRLAIQSMIGRGTVTYDSERHYSLAGK